MGAHLFWNEGMELTRGEGPKGVFARLVDTALWEHGHGGYSGTIAEKHDFVVLPRAPRKTAAQTAHALLDADDPAVADKWGPAGCVECSPAEAARWKKASGLSGRHGRVYIFFGWASA